MSLMDIHTNEIYYDTSSSKLRNAALAPATLITYNNNINKFLTFTRLSLPELLRLSPDLIDQRLSEYIDHMLDRFIMQHKHSSALSFVGLLYDFILVNHD